MYLNVLNIEVDLAWMQVAVFEQRAWLSWAAVGLLSVLCVILAALQYRWIGEIADAERNRLHDELQMRLNTLGRSFNEELANATLALYPPAAEVEKLGRDAAYTERYLRWRETHDRVFRHIAIVAPEGGVPALFSLNLSTGEFTRAEWPPEWRAMHNRILQRLQGRPPAPQPVSGTVFEFPRFGLSRDSRLAETDWLVLEVDTAYARSTLLPRLLNRYLSPAGRLDYEAQVVETADPSALIYDSAPGQKHVARKPDATVALMDIRPGIVGGRGGRGPGPGATPGGPSQGRWQLLVWNKAGSLETLVDRTRARNLAISGALMALLLAAVGTLIRLSRQAQKLALAKMNFVAGVSHELRTPLTVIRTAAFNLQGKLANRPDAVSRYGALIQGESERLEGLVEQVLRFASQQAGQVIHEREPYLVDDLIEEGLRSSRGSLEGSMLEVEKHIDPDLPIVLADKMAMRHALRNLIENAVKYGMEGSNWIGVSASAIEDASGPAVEIRVADRGPGIPPDEQKRIFDPFFRGRRAVRDQVHGTGLGLNLVKNIVEAHGGSIRVTSEPMRGTEFILRIPAAPPEMQNEFTHTLN